MAIKGSIIQDRSGLRRSRCGGVRIKRVNLLVALPLRKAFSEGTLHAVWKEKQQRGAKLARQKGTIRQKQTIVYLLCGVSLSSIHVWRGTGTSVTDIYHAQMEKARFQYPTEWTQLVDRIAWRGEKKTMQSTR